MLTESSGDEREPMRQEVDDAETRGRSLEERLQALLLPKDPNEGRNVIMEIRGAVGGDEANLFARNLYDMYLRFAAMQKWKVEVLSEDASDKDGINEAVFLVKGPDAYLRLEHEGGTHRVQRVPVTEAKGRIHTSTATVTVLPEAEEVDVDIDPNDLKIDVYRSTGPGGQSVNTTDSAVRITHLPSGTVVAMQDEKSQIQNRAKAMVVLRSRLLKAEQDRQAAEMSAQRRGQVGSGSRTDKIRTYNFKENRVTDHRINLTLYKLDQILAGDLTELTDALMADKRARQLEGEEGDLRARGEALGERGGARRARPGRRARRTAGSVAPHEARFIVDEALGLGLGSGPCGAPTGAPTRRGGRGAWHGRAPRGRGAAAVRLRALAVPHPRPPRRSACPRSRVPRPSRWSRWRSAEARRLTGAAGSRPPRGLVVGRRRHRLGCHRAVAGNRARPARRRRGVGDRRQRGRAGGGRREPRRAAHEVRRGAAARRQLVEGSWLEPLPGRLRGRVGLVVSNPPYVSEAEWGGLDAEVRAEPRGAWWPVRPSDGVPGLADVEAVLPGARLAGRARCGRGGAGTEQADGRPALGRAARLRGATEVRAAT